MTTIPASEPYYDLGNYSRPITTKSPDCQKWFDRGMVWTYAFNHEEAARCFENAIAHDPDCAIAYWGVAFSSGPNYNKPWEVFDKADFEATLKKTYHAAKRAKELVHNASTIEQALISAVQSRYQDDDPSKSPSNWNPDYADEMEQVYRRYGDDLDVAALYADSIMTLTPWAMWDLQTGKPASNARTIESRQILERALESDAAWDHPGLLHLYVHLFEMSPEPERALTAADRLRYLTPDAGHLVHMPSHLDILVGEYRAAIAANAKAIIADNKLAAKAGVHNFYTLYRLHDYHSLIYAAMFAGQGSLAVETVEQMEKAMPESLLRVESPPMADWTEVVLAVRSHVLIRFGRWSEIINLELPHDQRLYCVTTASIQYAKGIAYAAQGNVKMASIQQELFEEAYARVPESRMDLNNKCVTTLAIGKSMLAGELEYRKGNIELAFEHLQTAVDLDDKLVYAEPWAWLLPTRHAFAALLLEQNHVEQAAALYQADLGLDRTLPRARQHPNNVWALHGYHECLRRLGKDAEADLLDLQLKVAIAVADVDIKSSCFCRLNTEPAAESCCDGNKK